MENKSISVRELVLFALLGAVMFAGKMAMAGLPNIEPVSLLVILFALVFGRKALWSIYLYVALECVVWGLNTWSISYLYVWLMLYLVTRLLRGMDSLWAGRWSAEPSALSSACSAPRCSFASADGLTR